MVRDRHSSMWRVQRDITLCYIWASLSRLRRSRDLLCHWPIALFVKTPKTLRYCREPPSSTPPTTSRALCVAALDGYGCITRRFTEKGIKQIHFFASIVSPIRQLSRGLLLQRSEQAQIPDVAFTKPTNPNSSAATNGTYSVLTVNLNFQNTAAGGAFLRGTFPPRKGHYRIACVKLPAPAQWVNFHFSVFSVSWPSCVVAASCKLERE